MLVSRLTLSSGDLTQYTSSAVTPLLAKLEIMTTKSTVSGERGVLMFFYETYNVSCILNISHRLIGAGD